MSEETDNNISFADLDYPNKIIKIYHISDIHIRLQKRHDEYKKVFTNLYNSLKEEVKSSLGGDSSKGIIIITGDILHSKTELSPECVSLTADFFQKLAKIMPLIIMAGNHDANLNNNNRLDSLTPIVEKVISRSQCYYLRQSGFYRFNNLLIGLTSVFDYNFINASDIPKLELDGIEHTVALFHGRVDGAITDTGTVMEGERGINKKSFDGYDYVLLGDIHKQQFLIPEKMAYAGSLIQQNHGESQTGHGYLIWDLENKTVSHREVKNDYGFVTLRIKEGKLLKTKDCYIPQKCYLRLEIDDKTTREEQKTILQELNEKRTILELIQTNVRSSDGTGTGNDANEEADDKMLRALSFNVLNHQYQNTEIEKFLNTKKVSEEMIEKVKTLNTEYNQQILVAETILGGSWKLKLLEFSNLFCYGEDNSISFEKSKGIIGLVAPNHSGKSSIIDIILFTLFDKTSRKGTARDILRLGEKSFKCKLEIEMDNKIFVIKKVGTKKSSDVMSVSVDFSYYSNDTKEPNTNTKKSLTITKLTGKTPAETKRTIESYFGTFDDMVMTSVSLQNNNTQFADSTTSEKRKEFEKLLRIDIFEKLKDVSSEVSREKKAIIKHLTSELPEDALKILLDEHITLQEKMTKVEGDLIKEKENLGELRQLESGLMVRLSSAINQIPSQYKDLVKRGNNELDKYRNKLVKDVDTLKDEFDLEAAAELFSSANLDEWKTKEKERKTKLREVESKIDELTRKLHYIPAKEGVIPPREREKASEEFDTATEEVFKLKQKLKKLRECDWEEKTLVAGICGVVIEKQIDKHPRKGKMCAFYDDLEKTINQVLDEKYQAGSNSEIDDISVEIKKKSTLIDKLGAEMTYYDEYYKNQELRKKNEKTQGEIDVLKKKKRKLDASEFDISAFMDYQKLGKMEEELKALDEVFDNLTKYSECHGELNDVMGKILRLEKLIDNLEEKRGNLKGSIGVVETEMKTSVEKKKKLEMCIMEMDVLSTYQDCLKTIPFIIIDKIIPQLEQNINMMLTSLVNFTLNFKISEKELNIYITRPHGQIPLSNASGFEKFVGSLFLRMGLINISNLPKANFLAIDEGWSNFDYENMNNVGMIMDYLRGEFDFVILVSHLQAMREQTDQQINIKVEKKPGANEYSLSSVKHPF